MSGESSVPLRVRPSTARSSPRLLITHFQFEMASQLRHHTTVQAEACEELYAEEILLPRVAMMSVVVTAIAATVVTIQRRQRHQRRLAIITLDGTLPGACEDTKDSKPTGQRMQSRLRLAVLAGFLWTLILFLSFQTYDFRSGLAEGSSPGRPRMVFSFTTTTTGIEKIEPTIAALVNQRGDTFDAIYVVVPREYRGEVVQIPSWLVASNSSSNNTASDFHGWKYSLNPSSYHDRVHVLVIDKDFGPASKVLGTLLVEQDPETIIVYGDDDRQYPPELAARALHYTTKFPDEAVAVLGGWISAEDSLYCGRSLEVGINRVSFVGGAGGVVVRRKFFGRGLATTASFAVLEMSKACFLGDDYYLSLVLSRNSVRRRVVYDSCWRMDRYQDSFTHSGLSGGQSSHAGGANVEHYQQCIRELGVDNDLSGDAEFGRVFMMVFSRVWGAFRIVWNVLQGNPPEAC